jgi:hypothetical protein
MDKMSSETMDRMGNFHNAMVVLIDQCVLNPAEALAVLSMLQEYLVKILKAEAKVE